MKQVMSTKRSWKERTLHLLRLQTRQDAVRVLLGVLIGTLGYIAFYPVDLPSYMALGLITVQIKPAILVIPVIAAFFGPLAGLLAGLLGSMGADMLFTQQIVAFGLICISYGLLGFIVGIPRYRGGLSPGRVLAKLMLFTMAGFLAMDLVYLGGLVLVVGENPLAALLYNFLPFFTPSLITLLVMTPVAVRILDALAGYTRKRAQ